MRAAYIEALGPAESIVYGELPTPSPGPSDVLVQVRAASVNQVDTFVRAGTYRTPVPFPFVIGRDLVGTVVRAGPGATRFAAGDRVWCNSLGHAGRQGSAAQYAVVAADRLYPLPDGVPDTAVSLLHPAATAYLALELHAQLRPGETVLVAGGAGNIGRAATVLAVRAGARVITTSSAADRDGCLARGATAAFDYGDPELADRVAEVAPAGVDVHLDSSGRDDLARAIGLLATRGRTVVVAGRVERTLPMWDLYTRDRRIVGFVISSARVDELAGAAVRLNQLLAAGELRIGPVEELGLQDAADAHARLEADRPPRSRLVLRPPQDAG